MTTLEGTISAAVTANNATRGRAIDREFRAMKVNVSIDCTPEEARTFLGLPDVQPMNEAMMAEMSQRMRQAMQAMDPDTILKTWMPASMQGWEQMQKMFWNQMAGSMNTGYKTPGSK
jgi:hypothetical protein